MPYFDEWGWASDVEDAERETQVALPERVSPGYRPWWDGFRWRVLPYLAVNTVPVAPILPQARRITRLAFRNRFTIQEKSAIDLASIDNPEGTLQQRLQASALRIYLQDIQSSTYVDLDREDTQAGVRALEEFGLLAFGRATQILTAEIQPEEVWR